MIDYYKGFFGISLLFRLHGSGLYRAMVPGVVSVLIYLAINRIWRPSQAADHVDDLDHPYGIGVLVGSVSFLIVFRANYGYQRYWEACGATFQMMSKWLDATTHTACYHMQCDHYDSIKPPSYYDYPDLNDFFLTRARERGGSASIESNSSRHDSALLSARVLRHHKSINFIEDNDKRKNPPIAPSYDFDSFSDDEPTPLMGPSRLDGGWKGLFPDGSATYFNADDDLNKDNLGFASTKGGRTPSLFLQELAHLASLMNAVALSTLRNDVEGAPSPVDIYEEGAPWPQVDPDKIPKSPKKKRPLVILWTAFKYLMSADRTPEARTKYNSSRPLPVLGGVSDNEIKFLQMARGPSAKTQLAWQWLSEFITREHLAGSTGKVGPPIISRIIQFLGDGMIFYNHARKIMFIPFPFPHAQLSVFYVTCIVPTVPFMMDQYTNETWLGALLSFLTVTCLAGLHEVARELENPFRNTPNDIPVVTLQAMYNEALITMYAGYHPDAYWDPEKMRARYGREPSSSSDEVQGLNSEKSANGEKKEEKAEEKKEEKPDISKLQDLVEHQFKEIERLRKLVEDSIETKKNVTFQTVPDSDER